MRKLLILFFIVLFAFRLSAQSSNVEIVVKDHKEAFVLNEYTYLFSTKDKKLGINDVLKNKFNYAPDGLNIGLTDKIHWVKFYLHNPTKQIKEIYIFFPYNDINKIEPYIIHNQNIDSLKPVGTYYSQKNKDFPSRGYPILLKLKPGKTTLIIKVEHLYLPLRGVSFLLSGKQVLDNTLETQKVLSMWQGILLFVLIFTFAMYFVLKVKTFLYYSILNVGILLFFFGEVGDYFLFFNRDIYNHIIDIKHLGNVLVIIFLPLFINELADIKSPSPRLWKIVMYGLAIGPVAWAICLIPAVKDTYFLYYTTLYFIIGSGLIFLLMLYFTFVAFRRKHKNALAVFIIYLFYFSAAFINLILPNLGAMHSELLVYNSFIYGSLFEFSAFLVLIGNETLSVFNQRTRLLEKEKTHQAEIIKAIVESQEHERNKVGRELHDMIGANISVIKQQIDKNNKSLISVVERTIDAVRNLSHGLITPLIKDDEFVDEINELCVLFSDIDIQVKSHFHNWDKQIEPEKATHLYRIVQELLQNAVKHSQASQVYIQFIVDNEGKLTLMYEDDGNGFDYDSAYKKDGLGLKNIENRIELINATAFYDTKVNGSGTTIIIEVK